MNDLAVSNGLLIVSTIGIGAYIYGRPHLSEFRWVDRTEHTIFATVLFNFGSLLMTVLLKGFIPSR